MERTEMAHLATLLTIMSVAASKGIVSDGKGDDSDSKYNEEDIHSS